MDKLTNVDKLYIQQNLDLDLSKLSRHIRQPKDVVAKYIKKIKRENAKR